MLMNFGVYSEAIGVVKDKERYNVYGRDTQKESDR